MDGRIGKYQVRSELGRGKSSVVYLAYDEFLNSDLAVKVYTPESEPERANAASVQFVSEASLAGKLVHPHIVTIVDAVAEPNLRYVAMEYVPGGNLQRHTLRDRLLPVDDVVQIGFKCCGALEYAHRHGVVHRDIKPSNILISSGNDVKVADFGAAFVRGVVTTQHSRLGSPSYVAPEQIRDEQPSPQGDMFSLGVMIYEMLTGQKPFRGANLAETLERILRLDPTPPSRLRPDLPASVDPIVLRMLAKSPGERYGNWAEVALELAKLGRLSVYDQIVPDSEKYSTLRSSPLLSDFDELGLWELARLGSWSRVPAQHVLVREGDQGDSLFILARGAAKVMVQGRLLDLLRAGDSFGDMAFVQGEHAIRSATVQTATDAIVVEFSGEQLNYLPTEVQLKFTRALLRIMAERLSFTNARLARDTSG
jgi:eukaryotic-like serine/threonine-protein kinase